MTISLFTTIVCQCLTPNAQTARAIVFRKILPPLGPKKMVDLSVRVKNILILVFAFFQIYSKV